MKDACTVEQFLADVSTHTISIKRDEGVYRHITCRKPGTTCYGFDIITWPGYLAYTGDMGSFTFSRVDDMFTFFRTGISKDDQMVRECINLHYWSEKLQAVDRTDGFQQYSPERFVEIIMDNLNDDEDATPELREAIKEEVLSAADDGPQAAYNAATDFECYGIAHFSDGWVGVCYAYTFGFIWCCYALVWGIRKYDEYKARNP
jgi:hypothetical protein